MPKKRSVFDINFVPDDEVDEQEFPAGNGKSTMPRRGPMASAITEAAEATQERARAEEAIRSENDALAHEHVRLKKLGLITDLIAVDDVKITKLTRDRAEQRDPDLDELKRSVQDVGLSNPIRVEQTDNGYELIQGFRRLSAFRELLADTADKRYARIPAALVPRGEPLADLYRKMVDENLVRRDISFGEMAQLALSFAADENMDIDAAVGELYASARKQKRTYIRTFARVISLMEGHIRHVEAIPRALGLDLGKVLDVDTKVDLIKTLKANPDRGAAAEIAILRDFLSKAAKPKAARSAAATGKTTLRLNRVEGEARIIAADGKLELRMNKDFSSVSRDRLQTAINAFFAALDED